MSSAATINRVVIAAVDDMFFAAKIRATAEHLGVQVQFARSNDSVIKAANAASPALIIVDLHSLKIDALTLSRQLKADNQLRGVPLVGFFSHVDTELKTQAEDAGFDQVLPRSLFTRNLSDILSGAGRFPHQ